MVEEIRNNFDGKNYKEEKVIDILFNKIIMKKRNDLKYIFEDEVYEEFLKELWYSEENTVSNKKIDNIAIELNNKIIEIANYFKERDVQFYEEINKTSLSRLVLEKLFEYYNEAYKNLIKTYKAMENLDDMPEQLASAKQFKVIYDNVNDFITSLTRYQKISNNDLWKYDLNKNIVSTIIDEFYSLENKADFIPYLEIYISDMKKLGLNTQIKELRDIFIQFKSVDFKKVLTKNEDSKEIKSLISNIKNNEENVIE